MANSFVQVEFGSRRVRIPVTLASTMQWILDEVCSKQMLDSRRFELQYVSPMPLFEQHLLATISNIPHLRTSLLMVAHTLQ